MSSIIDKKRFFCYTFLFSRSFQPKGFSSIFVHLSGQKRVKTHQRQKTSGSKVPMFHTESACGQRRTHMKRQMSDFVNSIHAGMTRFFGLKIYGESNLTPASRSEISFLQFLLLLQLCVESWAWTQAWSYGLPVSSWAPPMLGLAFGLAIFMFDRALIVSDTSSSRKSWFTLLGRAVALILISLVTSVPVELAIFSGEIESRINTEEKADLDAIRTDALKTEDARYDSLIATAGQRTGNNEAEAKTMGQTDLDTYKTDRDAKRVQLLKDQTATLKTAQDDFDNKSTTARNEAVGVGPSKRRGAGKVYQEMKKQEAEAKTRRDSVETQNTSDLRNFDEETRRETVALEAKRDSKLEAKKALTQTKLEALEADKANTLAEVQIMDGDKLAEKYGGSWRKPRGLLARFVELQELAEYDAYVRMIMWGVRAAFIFFGVLILGKKIMMSAPLRWYYSFGAQVARGHDPEVMALAKSQGYTDEKSWYMLGLSPAARDNLRNLFDVRQKLAIAYADFLRKVAKLAEPESNGFCPDKDKIYHELHSYWTEKVLPEAQAVDKLELEIKTGAYPIPEWERSLGPDPRMLTNATRPTLAELAALGWQNPDRAKNEIPSLKARLAEKRSEIEIDVLELETMLVEKLADKPDISHADLRDALEAVRHSLYCQRIAPKIRELRQDEAALTDLGINVENLPWHATFIHSTKDITTVWQIPKMEVLGAQYNWIGKAS